MTSNNDHLDAASFESLAREAVSGIDPPPDFDAMLLIFNLIRTANRIQYDLETLVHRPAGATWAAFRVLFTVYCMGPIPPARLARLSSVSAASVSAVLATLERNKLIKRRLSPTDGRSVIVELTARGKQVVETLISRNNEREKAWSAALTPAERKTATRLFQKLLNHHPIPAGKPGKRIVGSAQRAARKKAPKA